MSLDESRIVTTNEGAQAQFAPLPGKRELREYVITHIDQAVEESWIRPYYQPVIRTLTGKLCGAEALARWEDPVYGVLPPAAFIEVLEEAKLIHLLDCCIIRKVCEQYRESVDSNVPVVPISFNLSRLDFDLCDVFSVVEQAVRENEVPRGMLNIEITETVFGADPMFMASMVAKFHDVGYQVWMDDFGSGYSTLNALKDFDFDELKLDMAFLKRFGKKSRTIMASVVDMAKKLGLQTLAEGVETENHSQFLRIIGCEKMQGYLFGRPMRYDQQAVLDLCNKIGYESRTECAYYDKIGSINMLSLSERDLTAEGTIRDYATSMPLAIMEYYRGQFFILDANRVFMASLMGMGMYSIEDAERRLNDDRYSIGRQARRLIDDIEHTKYARLDYVYGDTSCVIRAKYVTSQAGRIAILASIDDAIERSERQRRDRKTDALSVLYNIYEHIDIIHLDEGYTEPVFSTADYQLQYDASKFDSIGKAFAEAEIYAGDRQRYIEFMDHDTMIERIDNSGDRLIVEFFRARQKGGDYAWKLFGLVHLIERPGEQVMLCIRSVHHDSDAMLQARYSSDMDEITKQSKEADLAISAGSLWRALSDDKDMCIFWKDRERRFVGANQAFLDYYGFESLDVIKGKTDEDMGWHVDPKPYMEDEYRVLNTGAHISGVVGHCIIRGEVHDIVATKRPVYRNGRIVGLVGYFVDAQQKLKAEDEMRHLPMHDAVTGVLNFTGLEAATWRYVDVYKRLGIDFAMISINIENYQAINKDLGCEYGDRVLARIAKELQSIAGNHSVIGHVHSNRFVILVQGLTDDQLQEMCDDIEHRLVSITQVDGFRCTVYSMANYSRYSDLLDIEAMKRENRERRIARRKEQGFNPDEGDIITSSVLQ